MPLPYDPFRALLQNVVGQWVILIDDPKRRTSKLKKPA